MDCHACLDVRFCCHYRCCRYGVRFFEPLLKQLLNFVDSSVRHGAPRMLESDRFADSLKAYYGKETFATAFARTGRIVCITVTTQRGGGQAGTSRSGGAVLYGSGEAGAGSGAGSAQPLVLNYLTSPDVLVSYSSAMTQACSSW